MEDNINLDDDNCNTKNKLNDDIKTLINQSLLKIFNLVHEKPYILRRAMLFKDWKIKAGIKQEEKSDINKKVIKKVKKKKVIKKDKRNDEKTEEKKDILDIISKENNIDKDIVNNNDKNIKNNSDEKKEEKVKKVKKVIKKKIIKKKLSFADDADKISVETNLTSPNLVANSFKEQFIDTDKENEIISNISVENISNKKVVKKKKIIKKKKS